MVVRRYGEGSRGRSQSPRRLQMPRFRDFDNPRHRREEYSRDADRSGRTERRSRYDSDFDANRPLRFSEYDNRDRDRYVVGAQQSSSPLRIEKRDLDSRGLRFSEQGNGDRDRYNLGTQKSRSPLALNTRDGVDGDVGTRAERLRYYDDGDRGNYKNSLGIGSTRLSIDEESYRVNLSSMKFQSDHLLDGPRKSDHLNVKDYSHVPDHYGVHNSNFIRDGSERDDYWQSRYIDSSRPGLLLSSQDLDSDKLVYGGSGRMHSRSYIKACGGGVDDMPRSNLSGGDGSSHMSFVASRCISAGGGLRFRDELLGMEETEGRDVRDFKKEGMLASSQGYLKADVDYLSVSSGSLRGGVQGYSAMDEIHVSHAIRPGSGLTSGPISLDGYREENRITPPRGPGGRRSYLGLPEENQEDHLYTEVGRSKNFEEPYREHVPRVDVLNPTIDHSSFSKYARNDALREQYPFSHLESATHRINDYGPLLNRKQDLGILGAGSSRFSYGTKEFHQYRLPDGRHADISGGPWSNNERLDTIQSAGYDPSYGGIYGSPRKKFALTDLSLAEPSDRRLGRKQVSNEILYEHGVGIKIETDGNGSRKIYNRADEGGEIGTLKYSKKPESRKSNYRRNWKKSRKMVSIQPSSSKSAPSHSVKTSKSSARDIKRRLGPVSHKLHVSRRIEKKYKPSMKKRLEGTRLKKHGTLPWLQKRSSKRTTTLTDDLG